KWEFPGGKVRDGEAPEAALARELREELNATVLRSVAIARVTHQYADRTDTLEIQFYAVRIAGGELKPVVWEQTVWVLPRELSSYDFLTANSRLVADLATGRIKPGELLNAGGT